ncbi:MAG: efflux RND transporter periplasmic adaptor subunit [Ignavibacteria bacterium]|nr:efflux RND transporter periplasmic adaptor subunit [Ignavibacteria bacterium]
MRIFRILSVLLFTGLILTGCKKETDTSKIKVSGNLEAISVTLSSQTPGLVVNFPFEEGDVVKENDTIVKIDDSNLLLQLAKTGALIEGADAQYSLLLSGARKEDIKQAEEVASQLEANVQLAESDFARIKNLYGTGSMTKKQYDDAETRLKVLRSQLDAAKENLQKVKTIVRPEELKSAAARKKEASASADILKNAIEKCFVISPISGKIVKKYVKKGEVAGAMSSLVKISAQDELDLIVYVQETDLGKVKTGQTVDIKIDSYPNKSYTGKVIFISPEAAFTPKNIQTEDERTRLVYEVKVRVKNQNNELKDGMPADAFIKL